jgi:hypothetical protein
MGPDILRVAQSLALRWYCVVPVIGKAPCHSGGRGWADGSRHLPEVDHLFRTRRHTGVGIACGEASGCWVLDEDGPTGAASLRDLIDQHGPLPAGPVTVTGKGRHYWFSWAPGCDQLRNRVSFLPGLDVRTSGGGVVVPPSLHPNAGRRYEWRHVSLLDVDPPQAPAWLVDAIISTYPAEPDTLLIHPASTVTVPDRYAEGALASAEFRIVTAGDGQQRATLYVEALSIGARIVGAGLCPASLALDRLTAAGMRMVNHKPQRWTEPAVQRVVADGLAAGIGRTTDAA